MFINMGSKHIFVTIIIIIVLQEVSVCVGSSDQWLCVARLPLSYTEASFSTLVSGRLPLSYTEASFSTLVSGRQSSLS